MADFICLGNDDPRHVEAVQWDGEALKGGAPDWIPAPAGDLNVSATRDAAVGLDNTLVIQTTQGMLRAPKGYWIVKQENGVLTICAPDMFRRFYQPA